MKIGVSATFAVALGADPGNEGEYLQQIARVLEDSGYDSIWLADRTVYPVDLVGLYPDRWGPGQADPQGHTAPTPSRDERQDDFYTGCPVWRSCDFWRRHRLDARRIRGHVRRFPYQRQSN